MAGARSHAVNHYHAELGTPPRRAKSGLDGGHGRESSGWSGGGEQAVAHPPRGEEPAPEPKPAPEPQPEPQPQPEPEPEPELTPN